MDCAVGEFRQRRADSCLKAEDGLMVESKWYLNNPELILDPVMGAMLCEGVRVWGCFVFCVLLVGCWVLGVGCWVFGVFDVSGNIRIEKHVRFPSRRTDGFSPYFRFEKDGIFWHFDRMWVLMLYMARVMQIGKVCSRISIVQVWKQDSILGLTYRVENTEYRIEPTWHT